MNDNGRLPPGDGAPQDDPFLSTGKDFPAKKIAILVIAAATQTDQPRYIENYWTELKRHLKAARPHIDVFLLFGRGADLGAFSHLSENILEHRVSGPGVLSGSEGDDTSMPGIFGLVVDAFELLHDRYDAFFLTDLQSLIRVPYFDRFVQGDSRSGCSGNTDSRDWQRPDPEHQDRIDQDESTVPPAEPEVNSADALITGSGYLLNAAEVKGLVQRKKESRFDRLDDAAIGAVLSGYGVPPGFSVTISPRDTITEAKCRIRRRNAAHVSLHHFPQEKSWELWKGIASGLLWKVPRGGRDVDARFRIYFPLFDHREARSNEVRLTHEGLEAHPRVRLVDDPEDADYLIFCQNHLVGHCPFHTRFRPIKDRYKHKTIMLDYDDSPNMIYDPDDFRWMLYFKRSCVDRETNRVVDFGGKPIMPTAYCVANDMVEPPGANGENRNIAVSCLFDDPILDSWVFRHARGRLLEFAKALDARYDFPMQIGTVSESGPVGRSAINERYKRCLYDSKIVLHANPDHWEGDARTWEALSSGALVFIDRMCQPIPHPLVDGEHVIFYDLTDEGMALLEERILYYLGHEDERERIGRQGREFVLSHHRSIHRINDIIDELDTREADAEEMADIANMRY